jgi:hypothetical protein
MWHRMGLPDGLVAFALILAGGCRRSTVEHGRPAEGPTASAAVPSVNDVRGAPAASVVESAAPSPDATCARLPFMRIYERSGGVKSS